MHKVLERQLRKQFGSLESVPDALRPLVEAVDRFYGEADADRALVERSLELTSRELLARNEALTRELENRAYTESLRGAILDSALDAIILMDHEGIVREFNPAAQRTFGYAREEAIGRQLASLIIPPELRGQHEAGLRHYLATGQGPVLRKRIEIEGVRKDGTRIPVELAIIPFTTHGQAMFAGYLRDLTERRRDQEEIRRRTATIQILQQVPLLANEARTIEEAARICLEKVCEFTRWPLGHAFFANESGTQLVSRGVWHPAKGAGYEAFRAAKNSMAFGPGHGLPGRVWESRKPLWIPDLAADANFPRASLAEAAGLRSAFAFPVLVGGRVLAVLEFFSPRIQEPDADLLEVLANVGNQLGRVVERRRAEADLKQAYEQLKEVDRARIQFINNAAHELGTPLTPIRLQMQVVKHRLTDRTAPQDRKSVEILERNVDRLTHLVKDLLDSARLQTGKLEVRPVRLDLAEEAERSTDAYRQFAEAAGLQLDFRAGGQLPVDADPLRIGQVLDNLLANAIKFTPRGGRVTVHASREGRHAKVEVQDNGIGISAHGLSRLFHPFSQVHDTMQITQPGTGLGLYISRGIVEATGGQMGCSSPGPGKGATFWLTLPLREDGSGPPRDAPAPGRD